MTDSHHDPVAAREELEGFRDDFGYALVSATRERERGRLRSPAAPRRRRGAVFGLAVAAAAAVVVSVVAALPSPGDRDAPLLGASPAEAAVQELRHSLLHGVLIRRAEAIEYGRTVERTTQDDWTDLATRQQHLRIRSADPNANTEYWNPSLHERWTKTGALSAADGRPVIEYSRDDAENFSSERSPVEEVDALLAKAKRGDLVVRHAARNLGKRVLELERRERCFASVDRAVFECPDPAKPNPWPSGGPADMHPVTMFETWWLQGGSTPRILRYESGSIVRGTTHRDVNFRLRYTRWDVVPATKTSLRLVRPPAFPASAFLVVKGRNAVSKAIARGLVRCRGKRCP